MSSAIQAVRFDRRKWTEKQAEEWLWLHNYVPIKHVDKTSRQLRYRLREPSLFRRMVTIEPKTKFGVASTAGVSFVIGWR